MHAVFALTCLLAVIAGFALGRAAWTDGHRNAENIARHGHSVTATTVDETSYRAGVRPSSAPVTVATATWQYPSRRPHTETIPVPAGTRNGDTVRVWVDGNGNAVAAPPGQAEITLNAVGIGTGTLAGILLVGGALVTLRLRLVNARSARAWEDEWADIEPLWSGRLRPGQGASDE
ncbi:Rv1733c family protein [Streptomyces sp. IBSNAI002]|uniref:Rv1733c family protein n=1 Tax=Streptomyces sp. IBSNAI002 TaxID=3457500 RepID=UPI003FD35252